MALFGVFLYLLEEQFLPHVLFYTDRSKKIVRLRSINKNNPKWDETFIGPGKVMDSFNKKKQEHYNKEKDGDSKCKQRCRANISKFKENKFLAEVNPEDQNDPVELGTSVDYSITLSDDELALKRADLSEEDKNQIEDVVASLYRQAINRDSLSQEDRNIYLDILEQLDKKRKRKLPDSSSYPVKVKRLKPNNSEACSSNINAVRNSDFLPDPPEVIQPPTQCPTCGDTPVTPVLQVHLTIIGNENVEACRSVTINIKDILLRMIGPNSTLIFDNPVSENIVITDVSCTDDSSAQVPAQPKEYDCEFENSASENVVNDVFWTHGNLSQGSSNGEFEENKPTSDSEPQSEPLLQLLGDFEPSCNLNDSEDLDIQAIIEELMRSSKKDSPSLDLKEFNDYGGSD